MKLVECVPNFSEGQHEEIIQQIVAAIKSVDGIYVLGYDMDKYHNRTVVTFVGNPDYVVEAAFKGIAKATELINLNNHEGEHPRLGVIDVCPFIPLQDVTMDECIQLANSLAQKVDRELQIPIYLYEHAARKTEHRNLANIRLLHNELTPDFGSEHPTAGYICIGARFFLIAYNVNLQTNDIHIAKKIARYIREKDGGLKGIKALAFTVAGSAQVSMNITDYRKTSLHKVFHVIQEKAEELGVAISHSEIVGHLPQEAFFKSMIEDLRIKDFCEKQVIQECLRTQQGFQLNSFLSKLSSPTPTPGGGSCAALTGASAAALAVMITTISMGKKKNQAYKEELAQKQEQLQKLQYHLSKLIEEDSEAYNNYIRVRKMPRESEKEKKKYAHAMDSALIRCVLVPLDISLSSLKVLQFLPINRIIKSTISDAGISCLQAMSAIKSSHLTIRANLPMLKDPEFHSEILSKIENIECESQILKRQIMQKTNENMDA